MRYSVITAVAGVLFVTPALTATNTTMKSCSTNWSAMTAAQKSATTYKAYMTTCMATKAPAGTSASTKPVAPATAMPTGKPVPPGHPAPVMAAVPAKTTTPTTTAKPSTPAATMAMSSAATKPAVSASLGGSAKCKDGKIVTYKKRSGTCSGHGGVAVWM